MDRKDVKSYRQEMTDTAGQDEEMPDGVVERKFAPDVENHPDGIEEPAGHQQADTAGFDPGDQQVTGTDHGPPHAEIEGD